MKKFFSALYISIYFLFVANLFLLFIFSHNALSQDTSQDVSQINLPNIESAPEKSRIIKNRKTISNDEKLEAETSKQMQDDTKNYVQDLNNLETKTENFETDLKQGITKEMQHKKAQNPDADSKNELVNTLLGQNQKNKMISLMYDEEEIDNIARALDAYRNGRDYTVDDALLSDEEKKEKARKLDGARKLYNKEIEENERSYVYFASMMYFSPKDWTIWINNTKITSQDNKPQKEFFVRSIDQDGVRIRWSLGVSKWRILSGKTLDNSEPKINNNNQVEIDLSLKPNQTYILGSNKIIEGRMTFKPKNKTAERSTEIKLDMKGNF